MILLVMLLLLIIVLGLNVIQDHKLKINPIVLIMLLHHQIGRNVLKYVVEKLWLDRKILIH